MAATLTVSPKQSPFPFGPAAIAAYTGKVDINFDDTAAAPSLTIGGSTIDDDEAIIQALAKETGLAEASAKVNKQFSFVRILSRRVNQSSAFFTLAKNLKTLAVFPEIVTALDSVDDHLAFRTFLIGHTVSAADWALWGSLKG
jgi:glutamyl-tRNA synthetase